MPIKSSKKKYSQEFFILGSDFQFIFCTSNTAILCVRACYIIIRCQNDECQKLNFLLLNFFCTCIFSLIQEILTNHRFSDEKWMKRNSLMVFYFLSFFLSFLLCLNHKIELAHTTTNTDNNNDNNKREIVYKQFLHFNLLSKLLPIFLILYR
mgnify:CR=1 FL=1